MPAKWRARVLIAVLTAVGGLAVRECGANVD